VNWLNTPIPIYQLLIMVTVYVIYKELIKLLVKLTYKRLRRKPDEKTPIPIEPAVLDARQPVLPAPASPGGEAPQSPVEPLRTPPAGPG
jgi:hypothetical protein